MIVFPVPTVAVAKVDDGEPPSVTFDTSAAKTPTNEADPPKVAVVFLSYTLLLPVNPLMVNVMVVIFAVKPVGWVRL